MYYYLYKITNLTNNKIYVGVHQTKKLEDNYFGSSSILLEDVRQLGKDKFKKEILEFFENADQMFLKEKAIVDEEFIKRTDTYNLRRGGTGGFDYINKSGIPKFKGRKHSLETRKKISEKSKKRKVSEETKQKISASNQRTNESRGRKVSSALTGRNLSAEHKEKISKTIKEKYKNGDYKSRNFNKKPSFKWKILTPEKEVIEVTNLTRFCKENGLNSHSIYKGTRGFRVLDKQPIGEYGVNG